MRLTASFDLRWDWRLFTEGGLLFLLLLLPQKSLSYPYSAPANVTGTANDRVYESADVKFGDANNDGNLDLVVCGRSNNNNRQLEMYAGNGAGGWAAVTDVNGNNGGLGLCALALGDLNNDGILDIAATGRITNAGTNNVQAVWVFLRGGAGWTQVVVDNGASAVESGGLSLGDYDNDGDLDLLTTGIHRNSGATFLTIYQNDGDGTFTAVTPTGTQGIWNGGAAWADYDGDGDLDMLVNGSDDAAETVRRVRVYRNNGDDTWTAIDLTPGLSLGDVAWGDFNGDGLLDAAASGTNDGTNEQVRWWQNNGAGGFNAAGLVAANNAGLSRGRLAVGDVDRDGDLDIMANGSQNGTTPLMNAYLNNGAGVFAANAVGTPLLDGAIALADPNADGTLDLAAVGTNSGAAGGRRIYYYTSTSAANTAPNAPAGLAASFIYSSTGQSTATFQWNASTDAGAGATPANLLTYDIQIGLNAGFTGTLAFPSQLGASPRRGSYHRPPLIGGKHTAYLKSTSPGDPDPAPVGLQTNTTYYFRVRTVDAGLRESAWSATGTLFTPGPPAAVSDLAVQAATTDGQIVLTWTSPPHITATPNAGYDVRWSLTAITNDAQFAAATPLTGEPVPAGPGLAETMAARNVPPDTTVYFALKSSNNGGTSALSNSPSGLPLPYDRTQVEVDAVNGGLSFGDAVWGDYDGDGLADIAASGVGTGGSHVRVYRNLGGVFSSTATTELSVGLSSSSLVWGDYDGDSDQDLLATGQDTGGLRRIIVFRNDGGGAFTAANVVAAGQGLDDNGGTDWGDYDNDGDLDILVTGRDGAATAHIRVYKNVGGGAFNATPIELSVAAAPGGLSRAQAAWGDYDADGRLDIAVSGINTADAARYLRVFHNDGGDVFTEMPAAITGAVGIENRAVVWGDYNGDGRLDILENGYDASGTPRRLRVYTNNGGGAFTGADVDSVSVNGGGLSWGEAAFADWDMDGRADIVAQGWDGGSRELRLYRNTGGAFPWNNKVHVENAGGALYQHGAVSLADMDGDGDLDILSSGNDAGNVSRLRIYVNYYSLIRTNTAPNAPPGLASAWAFSTGTSTAAFKWDPATDNAPNATPPAALTYEVQAATNAAFVSPLVISGGSFQSYPLIYDGNTRYGTVLTSTFPWSATSGLMTDATYYFRIRTADVALAASPWSATGSLWTGVAPGSSTLAAVSAVPGQSTITWSSAGDDQTLGTLGAGSAYRLQYSTNASAAWSTSSTPLGVFTVSLSTANQAPGTTESTVLTGLTEGTSYYFRLWTQDDVGQWSAISGAATSYIMIGTRDLVLSTGAYNFGAVGLALSTQTTAAVTVTYTGNVNSTYLISAATTTAGSPWGLGAAAGADTLVLRAAMNAAQPAFAAFGAEDTVLTSAQACTAAVYALGQSCLNVAPGGVRALWFRLDMPTSSSDASAQEQRVQVTVTAGPP